MSLVILKPRKANTFLAHHPWVFPAAIDHIEGEVPDGAEIKLVSHSGSFIATGLWNSQSKICVRLYCWQQNRSLDRAFWEEKIKQAIQLRERLNLRGPRKACRLIFSEGDGLSGLTVDEYDGWLVVQFTSLALFQRREAIIELLESLLKPRGIYLRTQKGMGQLEGIELQDGLHSGEMPPETLIIEEGGIQFYVNLLEGQKTGYYLDQRDNRLIVAQYARNVKVLDTFCYSGGFGLYAAKAGAESVESVDVSESALRLAQQNADLNSFQQIRFTKSDVFVDLLKRVQEKQKFGLVILDPPKFASSRSNVSEALRGYRKLQTLGIQLVEPGGILVICCCSGVVTEAQLDELLLQIQNDQRREIQILHRLSQAVDHPVSVSCPESRYLKCTVCRVF